MIKGDMKIKRRDIDFVSESNFNLELHLGEVNVLHLEDSPTQTCGFISVKECKLKVKYFKYGVV